VSGVRRGVRRLLEALDVLYRRRLGLTPVGPLLFLGVEPLHAPALELADGTRLPRGTPIGQLHFNNARAAAIPAANRLQNGVRFARLLRHSLAELAAARGNHELFEGGLRRIRAIARRLGRDGLGSACPSTTNWSAEQSETNQRAAPAQAN
jgi:hypothetical protein